MMRDRRSFMSGEMKKVAMAVLGVMFSVLLYMSSTKVVEAENSVTLNTTDYEYAIATFADITEIKEYLDNDEAPVLEGYLFAGWFTDTSCTKAKAVRTSSTLKDGTEYYAKFVPEDVLTVKAQISTENTNSTDSEDTRNIRFVSSVDDLAYNRVGFMLQFEEGGETVTRYNTSKTVFERIASATAGDEYEFSPKVVDTKSEYFITATWKDIVKDDFDLGFYVRAYWKTLDGAVVYGPSRYVSVNDGLETNANIINLPVKDAKGTLIATNEAGEQITYAVTYNEKDVSATVVYHDEDYAHLRVDLTEGVSRSTDLDSVTSFTIGELSAKYRNLYTSYDSASDTKDTTWYTEYEGEKEFVIATSADLYGLAELVNNGIDDTPQTMEGMTIYVVSDISVNTVSLDPDDDKYTTDSGVWTNMISNAIQWEPIGHYTDGNETMKTGQVFAGIFDGQGHTISGICITAAENAGVGLFGRTSSGSGVQNLQLTNSYIESTVERYRIGSVVGEMNGSIDTVYSNVTVKVAGNGTAQVGGLVGAIGKGTDIQNCWYAGTINSEASSDVGGIVGVLYNNGSGAINISNCLYTGNITISGAGMYIGGILGRDNNLTVTVNTTNCLSAGNISASGSDGVGSVIGIIRKDSCKHVITNVYTTTESIESPGDTDSTQTGVGYDSEKSKGTLNNGTITEVAESDIKSYKAYTGAPNLGYSTKNNEDAYWAVTEKDVPVLKSFANNWIDVAWYCDAEKSEDVGEDYYISTAEEMYGLSAISQDYDFKGDTVYLSADIELNSGKATSWATEAPKRSWTPISTFDNPFAGTFNGQGHIVSGVYIFDDCDELTYNGLFAVTGSASMVQNFQLTNSYFKRTNYYAEMGSIVGELRGDMTSVYSNAILSADNVRVGGLIGRVKDEVANENVDISNCWFAGEITSTATIASEGCADVGGIVGVVINVQNVTPQTVNIENCLYTGRISNTAVTKYIGGILARDNVASVNVNISNTVSAGEIYAPNGTGVGSIVGIMRSSSSLYTLMNTYATNECAKYETADSSDNTKDGIGYDYDASNKSVGAVTEDSVATKFYAESDIKGYNLYFLSALEDGELDNFDTTWVARAGKVPALQCFVSTDTQEKVVSQDDTVKCDTSWYTDGTYLIENRDELYGLSYLLYTASESVTFEDTIKLGADIVINDGNAKNWGNEAPMHQWYPIGNANVSFGGIFDGMDSETGKLNTISGVYVKDDSSQDIYTGVFGVVGANGTVSNLLLKNSYFERTVATNGFVGSMVGMLSGTLDTVYSDAVIVTDDCTNIGGLISRISGSVNINNCWFAGSITGASSVDVGGIIGTAVTKNADSNIQNCLYTGNITVTGSGKYIGGIIGRDNNAALTITMENCLSAGNISASGSDGVGSVIGIVRNAKCKYIISNVYTTDDVSSNDTDASQTGVGYEEPPSSGKGSQGSLNNGTISSVIKSDIFAEGAYSLTGFDFASIWATRGNDVPVLRAFAKDVVESEERYSDTDWYFDDPDAKEYTIDTVGELYGINTIMKYTDETFVGKTIYLSKDLVVNEGEAKEWSDVTKAPAKEWTPIGNADDMFAGTFDGLGHTISGLYISTENQYCGLFGYTSNSTIQNLRLVNSYFAYTGTATTARIGSIAGMSIGNCTMSNVYTNAIVKSTKPRVGGLIGAISVPDTKAYNFYITSCWFDGTINVNYLGKDYLYIGGLFGYSYNNNTFIDTCLYSGNIECDFIHTDVSTITMNMKIGGFYGGDDYKNVTNKTEIKNSLSNGNISVTWNNNPDHTYTPDSTNEEGETVKGIYPQSIGWVNACVGYTNIAGSNANNNVYSFTKVVRHFEYVEQETASTKTETLGNNVTADNFAIDNSWIGNEENLYGLGAQLLIGLTFVREEGDTNSPIWAARLGKLPIPESFVDVVDDEITDVSVGKADTTWYYGHENNTSYTLYDIEDLYGLSVVSREYDFAGKTVYLANDIKVNNSERVDSTWVASDWAEKNVSALLPWQQIGINLDGQRFAGTFDGNGKTISGLYMKQGVNRMGLFGPTEVGSVVKNVRLTNSYFEQTGSGILGSIVAECRGAVSGAYSNAILVSEADEVGGIVARANGYNYATNRDDETAGFTDKRIKSSITNCWFDGTITSDKQYVGGIVASTREGAWSMTNCLFTGTIYDNYTGSDNAFIGGLCGEIKAQSVASGEGSEILTSLDVQSCISTGTIHTTVLEKGIGSVVGRLTAGVAIVDGVAYENYTSLNMENVFVTRDAGSKVTGSIGTASNSGYSTKAKVSGYATQINNADRFIGYCEEEAVKDRTKTYEAATLDFTSESPSWILRTDGVPVPATFADMVNKVADYQSLNSEIGLTYLNETLNKTGDNALSIEKAVNQGVGNYVLSVEDVTLDTYKGYLAELKSADVGFEAYVDVDFDNPVGTADDGVYNAIYTHKIADTEKVDWILNVLYVNSTKTMNITITSDESTLSPNLIAPKETTSTDKDITFAMLQLDGNDVTLAETLLYTYGSSYVFQLPDGDFIINDGGSVSGNDFNGLITFLAELAGAEITATDEKTGVVTALDKDINIKAWTVSHQHNDHIGVVRQFMVQEIAKQIHVEAFYISEPNNRAIHIEDFTESSDDATFLYQELELQYQGMRMLTKSDGKTAPDIYRYQTGQRYYFDGITMDVIQSQEIIPVEDYGRRNASAELATDYNTASGTLLYTIQNGGQKILISGDANHKNMDYIMDMYGSTDGYTDAELLQGIDVFTALHHGKNSSYTIDSEDGYKTYTDYFLKANDTFAVTLFPCSVYYGDKVGLYNTDYAGAFPYAKDANDYLKSKSTKSYHYGDGNVVFSLKTDGTIDKQ